ncbi:MAG: glutathione S-transferase family protein [Rhodobiaceae bacterium]|nr:glutathione S-transferase family protein [Rhodobiaceae bacterium]
MILSDEQVTTDEVKSWKGLHLLHFSGSSCSQKVRTLLREKGIDYVSHHVNLVKHEHASPWYLGINPRGVVPVLVHDGVVHVESNDILTYLDTLPSDADSFFPQTPEERAIVDASLTLENDLHFALREITMGFIFPKRLAQKPDDVLAKYEQGGADDPSRDKEIAWWRAFAEAGVTEPQARAAVKAHRDAFETLEKRLESNDWLIGDRISVLELAWFITMNRLRMGGYPLEIHPRLFRLYNRLLNRPAFARETKTPAILSKVLLPAVRFGQVLRGKRMKDVAGDILAA